MDKLQPIIKNRFWILAGLLLPIAMFGFFSANAKLSEATQAREEALKSTLSAVPRGTGDPNEKYAEGLAKINDQYSQSVEKSIIQIWKNQQQRMDWPPVVSNYVPPKFMGEFDYRGIVAYQEAYEKVMRDLQTRVEPVMPLDKPGAAFGAGPMGLTGGFTGPMGVTARDQQIADVPWKQKVILAASIPQARFGRMRATSDQIWNAQIDVWLLRLLFDAVARLNEDKDSVTEAVLRRIDVLELVGGDGEPVLTGGGSSGGGGYGGEGGEMAGMFLEESPGGGGGSYGGDVQGKKGKSVPIKFDPAQEFGSSADSSGSSDSDSGDMAAMTEGFGGGARQSGPKLRYIADSEDKPFLERGFYLSVILMQDKIPDFLVELANSEWPVRVTRFHVGKNPYYTESRPANYGTGFPGAGFGVDSFPGEDMEDLYSGMASGGEGALGGIGGNQGPSIPGVGGLTNNLPTFASAAMQHPNLVQVDLCGVITMYKQPQTIIDALENGTSPAGETPDASGDPELPVDTLPATDAAETPTEQVSPAAADPEAEASPAVPATGDPSEPATNNTTNPAEL